MPHVSDIMTRDVRFIAPGDKLQRAAQIMSELDVGALPVCDGERLVGMVTDRDIIVRGTAAGHAPGEACVADVMTERVCWCFEDQPLDELMRQMADSQVRRIPVVSRDEPRRLVGIVALGDLAHRNAGAAEADAEAEANAEAGSDAADIPASDAGAPERVAQVLQQVSEPSRQGH